MKIDLVLALTPYIPNDRVTVLLNPAATLPVDGVAMIADISGFTPLTEALTQGLRPDQGAEELTRALEAVFTPLITQIHAFRGSVIKFGGDALIVWFGQGKGERKTAVIRRALTAAWEMQQQMQTVGQVSTPIGPVALKMKIGLAYGPVKRFNLGLPEYGYEDVLAGQTLDRMSEAEHHANPGDIVADATTLAIATRLLTISEWREGFGVVGHLLQPAKPSPWAEIGRELDSERTESLTAYVPRQIVEMLQAGQGQVAELKPVVSLFVQFHGLDYDHDLAIGDKLQTYFASAQRVVARYNGRLNRLITGDKGSLLHIIFGAPRSLEEQEARAVRCALDLQTECGGLPFITMQRIGMATGRVFAGPVGSPVRHDYTVMGDTINLSARLMQNAADNQILIDSAVRSQLGDAFDLTDLGEIRVKGKAEPIHVFAPTRVRQTARQVKKVEQLFGRVAETAVLQHHLQLLMQGQGGIVFVVGDVGMGKTLLLDSWRGKTAVRWVSGISLAYGETLRGYLFIDLLRDLLDLPPGSTPDQTSAALSRLCQELFGPARLEATYPYLAQFMGLPLPNETTQRLQGLGGESLRWQLFQIIPELFRQLSRRQPIVVALDDLQWSDPTSLQLLELLWPLARQLAVLFVLAMRPEQQSRAWELRHEILQAINRPPAADLLLSPLDEPSAAELVNYHAPGLPERVVTYLVDKGGGNPLFLVEIVRTLQLRGLLSGEVELDTVVLDALDLPGSVQGLLLAQLDRLAVETRHTLQMAAVIGKTFLDQVLAAMAGAEAQVMAQLEVLEGQAYVQKNGRSDLGPSHTFRHILIQESTYGTLLYERRRAYHRQAAQALETLFPAQIVEQAPFLAHHYERAEDLEQAIYYYSQTADQARLLYANEEAETLYHKILSLLDQQAAVAKPNLDGRAKTYLKLAQTYMNTADFAKAQLYYEQAFILLEKLESNNAFSQAENRYLDEKYVLKWGILQQDLATFDPGLVEGIPAIEVVHNLFEGLVELDNELNVLPCLAWRWQIGEGGKQYLFELRSGLKWSDGEPLTAHDFVFAWQRNLDPKTAAGVADQLYVVQGAEEFNLGRTDDPRSVGILAINDSTLLITLTAPINYFLYLLADRITFPQPKHMVESQGVFWSKPQNLVCNGAFKIASTPEANEIRLVKNDFYRGFASGNLEKVSIRYLDPTFTHYLQQAVDWCRVDDRADLPVHYPSETFLVQGFLTFMLGFACQFPPFDQKAVRQAFVQSINRVQLVQEVWAGVQKPAMGGTVPPGMPGHSPETNLPFEPITARQQLQTGRLRKRLPEVVLATLPGFGGVSSYLQRAWQENLGVDVQVRENVPAVEALSALEKGEIQMILFGLHATYPDPDDILRGFHAHNTLSQYLGWQNAKFDELVDTAVRETNVSKRLALYHQADKVLVMEETAVSPLYYLQAYGLLRPPFGLAEGTKIIRGGIKFKNIVVRE